MCIALGTRASLHITSIPLNLPDLIASVYVAYSSIRYTNTHGSTGFAELRVSMWSEGARGEWFYWDMVTRSDLLLNMVTHLLNMVTLWLKAMNPNCSQPIPGPSRKSLQKPSPHMVAWLSSSGAPFSRQVGMQKAVSTHMDARNCKKFIPAL